MSNAIIKQALALVKPQFKLPLDHGWHGIGHWTRVWRNARFLCKELNLDPTVPCWFSYLHDSQRINEDKDPDHGFRAMNKMTDWMNQKGLSEEYKEVHPSPIQLTYKQYMLLCQAMEFHSDGKTRAPPIVQVCWDADRLDLWRVGIEPDPRYLCTAPAKRPETILVARKGIRVCCVA